MEDDDSDLTSLSELTSPPSNLDELNADEMDLDDNDNGERDLDKEFETGSKSKRRDIRQFFQPVDTGAKGGKSSAPSTTAKGKTTAVPAKTKQPTKLKLKGVSNKGSKTVKQHAAKRRADEEEEEKQRKAEEEAAQESLRQRLASPPREHSFADMPDLAFLVMFRSRFNNAFPKSVPTFGPQELEKDLCAEVPGYRAENFLCAVLGLLLNRKQDVKAGHYNRALEEAISSSKSQWPSSWGGVNPVAGQRTFNSLGPAERLNLTRVLVNWALCGSEILRTMIAKSYRQNRQSDDLNQPLSVQPWGKDSLKRRYYLIEGLDDTSFRIYREGNTQSPYLREWVAVAETISGLKALAERLERDDGGPLAKRLSQQMMQAVPRLETSEEKRKRREYRRAQKDRFKRVEPAFSNYEGRTRGKRVKYNFSEEDEIASGVSGTATSQDAARGTRRSKRLDPEPGSAGADTPPVVTASGRKVRKPQLPGQDTTDAMSEFSDHSDLPGEGKDTGGAEVGQDDDDYRDGRDGEDKDAEVSEEYDDDEDELLEDRDIDAEEDEDAKVGQKRKRRTGGKKSLVITLRFKPAEQDAAHGGAGGADGRIGGCDEKHKDQREHEMTSTLSESVVQESKPQNTDGEKDQAQ